MRSNNITNKAYKKGRIFKSIIFPCSKFSEIKNYAKIILLVVYKSAKDLLAYNN